LAEIPDTGLHLKSPIPNGGCGKGIFLDGKGTKMGWRTGESSARNRREEKIRRVFALKENVPIMAAWRPSGGL